MFSYHNYSVPERQISRAGKEEELWALFMTSLLEKMCLISGSFAYFGHTQEA